MVEPSEVSNKNCSNARQDPEIVNQDNTTTPSEVLQHQSPDVAWISARMVGKSISHVPPPAPSAPQYSISETRGHALFQTMHGSTSQYSEPPLPSRPIRLLFVPDPSRKLTVYAETHKDLGWTRCSVSADALDGLPPQFKSAYWHHLLGSKNDIETATMRSSTQKFKVVMMSEWVW